ncbi:unnamed protein product [marine sediment metagenome]|uniref:Uncharacterized protein n=1 Tax=marine sediment metagenome TaxID=412755 RepID=X1BQ63_9ZZZZ
MTRKRRFPKELFLAFCHVTYQLWPTNHPDERDEWVKKRLEEVGWIPDET